MMKPSVLPLAPWRIFRLLGISAFFVVVLAMEIALSLPIFTASLLAVVLMRLQWVESWVIVMIISLIAATLYLLAWPLTLFVVSVWYIGLQLVSRTLAGHPIRVLGYGLLIGVLPAVVLDVIVTERVIGLSLLGIMVSALLIWKVEFRHRSIQIWGRE